jgi:ketosteroid isomerase-like protein
MNQNPLSQQDRLQIDALATKYAAAVNKSDAAAISALFTEDGVFVTPAGILSGREGIEKAYLDIFKNNPVSDQVITTAEVHGEGNLSWAFGQWRNNMEHGNWGAVDKRSGDKWSIRMLTFNVTPVTSEA